MRGVKLMVNLDWHTKELILCFSGNTFGSVAISIDFDVYDL
jgi:hypothetical protein